MYSAGLLAESITRNWPEHRAEAEMALQQLPGVIRGALAGLRTMLFELRPATLEHMALSTLLRQLGEAMSLRADVPIAVRLQDSEGASSDVEPLLPPAVKVVFYRVAQEALMNAAKYAKAQTIRVRLRTRGTLATNRLELEVADDGRGFDPEAVPAGHFGLAIMRERAHAVGASVQVRSHAGQGTVVSMMWRRGTSATPGRQERAKRAKRHSAGARG
jgi:two-component system nitrate/nitrite sensor histidine kinase NarX